MIRILGFGAALLLLVPASTLGQKGKGKANNQVIPGTADEYSQLKKVADVVGKLASVDPGTAAKSFTLDIQYFYPAPDNYKGKMYQPRPGGGFRPIGGGGANLQNQWNSLLRQQQQLANIKNPAKFQQKLQQLVNQMQRLQMQMLNQQMRQQMQLARLFNQAAANTPNVKMASGFKEFDMEAIETVVVRRQNLPFEYDDKGNVKKYTKDELDKLKGKDKSLPGYEAKYEDLQIGQIVRVYLVKPKAKPKDDPKAKEDPKADKNQDKDKKGEDILPPEPPQVRMIVILADADLNAAKDNPRPKKKKNQ